MRVIGAALLAGGQRQHRADLVGDHAERQRDPVERIAPQIAERAGQRRAPWRVIGKRDDGRIVGMRQPCPQPALRDLHGQAVVLVGQGEAVRFAAVHQQAIAGRDHGFAAALRDAHVTAMHVEKVEEILAAARDRRARAPDLLRIGIDEIQIDRPELEFRQLRREVLAIAVGLHFEKGFADRLDPIAQAHAGGGIVGRPEPVRCGHGALAAWAPYYATTAGAAQASAAQPFSISSAAACTRASPAAITAPAERRRTAVPRRHDRAGAGEDRDQRQDVVGLQFGLDHEVDMAGRQHAIGITVAAIA